MDGKQTFDKHIETLKKTFLSVIQVALSLMSNQNRASPGDYASLGSGLEKFNSVCDDLYAQIYDAKQRVMFEELVGDDDHKLRNQLITEDAEIAIRERAEIIEKLVRNINSSVALRELLTSLPPALVDEMADE